LLNRKLEDPSPLRGKWVLINGEDPSSKNQSKTNVAEVAVDSIKLIASTLTRSRKFSRINSRTYLHERNVLDSLVFGGTSLFVRLDLEVSSQSLRLVHPVKGHKLGVHMMCGD